jgi:hypothetical protein
MSSASSIAAQKAQRRGDVHNACDGHHILFGRYGRTCRFEIGSREVVFDAVQLLKTDAVTHTSEYACTRAGTSEVVRVLVDCGAIPPYIEFVSPEASFSAFKAEIDHDTQDSINTLLCEFC